MIYEKKVMEFVSLCGELNRKIGDFNHTVNKLTTLQKYIEKADLSCSKERYQQQINKMHTEMKLDKHKTIKEEVENMGKLIVSPIYINSLKQDIQELEEKISTNLKAEVEVVSQKLALELTNGLKIKDLECQQKINILDERLKNKESQISFLKERILELKNEKQQNMKMPFFKPTSHRRKGEIRDELKM